LSQSKSPLPSSASLSRNEEGNDEHDNHHIEQQQLQIEKLDVRIPVDVWVSMGEPFAPLGG